jgi:disulfide bond formation protein DsbB
VTRADAIGDRPLLAAGAVVAVVATAGSLSLSEVMGLSPCDLCWYQRVLMYPLVVVLGVAVYENRPAVYRTALPLSLSGAAVAAYHSWIQATRSGSCSFGGGCVAVQYRLEPLGLTVPNLALAAFVMLSAVGGVCWLRTRAR